MSTINRNTAWMEGLFILLAIVAFAGTSVQLTAYLGYGLVGANINFWKETFATPASTFIVVDIFVLGAAVLIWMFGECRRLGIAAGWAWLYFLGSAFVGISIFVPLFLAHRQRRLRKRNPDQASAPAGSDFLGVAFLLLSVVAVVYYSFMHPPHS